MIADLTQISVFTGVHVYYDQVLWKCTYMSLYKKKITFLESVHLYLYTGIYTDNSIHVDMNSNGYE